MENQQLLMGNEAIALGALHAGVSVVCGYPGTPSTEVLETVARWKDDGVYVEWSVNEKAALELAAGAAYAGARSLVTMKQVGLNVASDPLMSLSYVGVKGGMVIFVADDPGPISSQTEQDTRHFARFSKLPVFDPCSPEEGYRMMKDAFDLSERLGTPVLVRATTRVCHGCASMKLGEKKPVKQAEGFDKDSSKWVIFPRLTYQNQQKNFERNLQLSRDFSCYALNQITGSGQKAIATGGISYTYTKDAMKSLGVSDTALLKIATPFPFPEDLAVRFLGGVREVLVLEELDPVIERELVYLCGKYGLQVKISGKLNGAVPVAGELSTNQCKNIIARYLSLDYKEEKAPEIPQLPVRPPVLCAGCPHRASFYAVKQAMKDKKAVFSGDIGCYTLGNAMPLDMVDTCLCMGAGVTVAQGLHRAEQDAVNFAFIGDSTFFASGITGVVNAVYNETDIVLVVLDNATTAMTGHQPHPGTGKTMMGAVSEKISIHKILDAIGVKWIRKVNPFDHRAAVKTVQKAAEIKGVTAVIFRAPCIAVAKKEASYFVQPEKCVGCKKCVNDLGCPAITMEKEKAQIASDLCYGCALCAEICPVKAIEREEGKDA